MLIKNRDSKNQYFCFLNLTLIYISLKNKLTLYYAEVQKNFQKLEIFVENDMNFFLVVLFLTSILRSDKPLNLSVIHRALLVDFEKNKNSVSLVQLNASKKKY